MKKEKKKHFPILPHTTKKEKENHSNSQLISDNMGKLEKSTPLGLAPCLLRRNMCNRFHLRVIQKLSATKLRSQWEHGMLVMQKVKRKM